MDRLDPDLLARASDVDRLDHLYLALIDLTEEMAARGLPVDDERRFLEANLNRRGGELLEVLRLTKTGVEADRDLTEVTVSAAAAEDDLDSSWVDIDEGRTSPPQL